ncbi:MAG: hypothetical protein AAGI28_10685, partial [Pseudomonadota bacterium]
KTVLALIIASRHNSKETNALPPDKIITYRRIDGAISLERRTNEATLVKNVRAAAVARHSRPGNVVKPPIGLVDKPLEKGA